MKTCVMVAGVALSFALLFALPLPAQERARGPAGGRDPREMLKRADTDGDGKVSKAEFVAARSAEMEEVFTRIDASGDGFLDEKEVTEFGDRMREMAGRAGGAPGSEGLRRPGVPGRRPEGDSSAEPMRRDGDSDPGALAEQFFDRTDTDGDGRLSREEYLAGASRLREMMRRGGGGMPGLGGRAAAPEEGFRRPPRPAADGTPPAAR